MIPEFDILRLTGARRNGAERDGGRLYHAVEGYRALCGKEPGRLSDWSTYPGERVTCKRCVARLEEIAMSAARKDENGVW